MLDVPETVGAMVWRVFSVLGLTALLITGTVLFRHPELIAPRESDPAVAERLRSDPAVEVVVMGHVSAFIHRHLPARFALVSWPTATTGEQLWSSEDTRNWPMHLDGMLSTNLIPAVGPLVFGECWAGQMSESDGWLLCPISSEEDVWGFVIAQWPGGPSDNARRSMYHLADRIESLIY